MSAPVTCGSCRAKMHYRIQGDDYACTNKACNMHGKWVQEHELVAMPKAPAPSDLPAAPDRCAAASHLFIALPCYTGDMEAETIQSLLEGIDCIKAAGAQVTWTVMAGCCYVCHARNQLVEEFLSTPATDLLFIDADMGFGPEALAGIMLAERPIVGGIYRKKSDHVDFNIKVNKGIRTTDNDGLLEVEAVATGFLRINRAVFDHMRPRTMLYGNGHEGGKKWRNWFRTLYEDGEFWGEDFQFCRDAKAAGLKIHAIPDLTLRHVGKKVYEGNWFEWMKSNGSATRKGETLAPASRVID